MQDGLHGAWRSAGRGLIDLDWTLTAAGADRASSAGSSLTDEGRRWPVPLGRGSTAGWAARRATGRPARRAGRDGRGPPNGLAIWPGGMAPEPSPASSVVASSRPTVQRERRCCSGHGRPGPRRLPPSRPSLTAPQREAVDLIRASIADRDPTPLLLDGVTGAGKTAVYVEAIVTSLEAGRPALVLVPEIALALPLVDRPQGRHPGAGRARPLGARGRRASRRVAADPGGRGRHRGRDAAGRPGAAGGRGPGHRGRGARRRPTRATGRRASRPATRPSSSPAWPARRRHLAAPRRRSRRSATRRDGPYRRVVLPKRPSGGRRRSSWSTSGRSWRRGTGA